MILRTSILGHQALGTLAVTNDSVTLVPRGTPEKVIGEIGDILGTAVIATGTGNTDLVGSLNIMNNHGIILSELVHDNEFESLKKKLKDGGHDLEVAVVGDLNNALGNNCLVGESFCLVNPAMTRESMQTIADVLDVEVERGSIMNLGIVGSLGVVTGKGMLLHRDTPPDEQLVAGRLFGRPVNTATVNFGDPMVGAGMVANNRGAIVGERTTGIEMYRIEERLDIID